jgi:inorganic triphosphatase YgiF
MSEVESAILILTKDKDFVFQQIDNLIITTGYKPVRDETKKIHDIYFDTIDDSLKKKKIALRIRILDTNVYKITLKAPKNISKNYTDRIEIEKSWSRKSFSNIMTELSSMGIEIDKYEVYYDKDPEKTFKSIGLKNIQDKQTIREIVNAVNKVSEQVEFEFAVDDTTLLLDGDAKLSFAELEIEAKKERDMTKLDEFVDKLTKEPRFHLWPFNKLETGLAVNYLYKNNLLKQNIHYDKDSTILREGFNKIANLLKSKIN